MTDYHVLRNKRYIITNSISPGSETPEKKVHLWSAETGKVIKTYRSKTFQQACKLVGEKYDLPSQIQVPVPSGNPKGAPTQLQSVSNPAIPNAWFTADIRVGSLTLHLDDEQYLKAIMQKEDYDQISKQFEELSLRSNQSSSEASKLSDSKLTVETPTQGPQQKVNIGAVFIEKIMKNVQLGIQNEEKDELIEYLGHDNYVDYLKLKADKQPEKKIEDEEIKHLESSQISNSLVYLEEADYQKPIWCSYTKNPKEIRDLLYNLPSTMAKQLKRSVPHIELSTKISFLLNTCDKMDLPSFDDSKRLSCPGSTTIKDAIQFAHGKLQFDKYIICSSNKTFDPLQYVELTLPVVKVVDDKVVEEFISLPQSQSFTYQQASKDAQFYHQIWFECDRRDSTLLLKYRTIKRAKRDSTGQAQAPQKTHQMMKPMEGDRDEANAETPNVGGHMNNK